MLKPSGWINLYKPLGVSSAAILNPLKRLLPRKTKVGHAGTLDVAAEGVLPVAIGEATKLVQFLMDAVKEYEFTIQFGSETDTLDVEGEVIATTANQVTQEQCNEVVQHLRGEVEQMPPIYSALKVNGKRAYDLARSGQEVQLKPRVIHIYDLQCVDVDVEKQQASYKVVCSKGTYVRSLARDIAKLLQNFGFVIKLRRLKVGVFSQSNAVSIEQIKDTSLESCLKKPEIVLDDIPGYEISEDQAVKVRNGVQISVPVSGGEVWLSYQESLVAVGNVQEKVFQSKRVFNL